MAVKNFDLNNLFVKELDTVLNLNYSLYPEYKGDIVKFAYDKLERKLSSTQEIMAKSVISKKVTNIKAGHGLGKCSDPEDYITLCNGTRKKFKDLVNTEFNLLTYDPVNQEIIPCKARAEWNLLEDVYEITTTSGKKIVRSINHPLWSSDFISNGWGTNPSLNTLGWTEVKDLKIGSLIASSDCLPAWGNNKFNHNVAKLLGYLIGDGALSQKTSITFTQIPGKQTKEFIEIVNILGDKVSINSKENNKACEYRIVKKTGRWGNRVPTTCMKITRGLGIQGCTSWDKFIPERLFTTDKETTSLFLSRLFSTDGWGCVNKRKNFGCPQIGYCSVSEQLIRDVQHLLQKFGIVSRLDYKKTKSQTGKLSKAWQLTILEPKSIQIFLDEIGIYGKEDQCDLVKKENERILEGDKFNKWHRQDLPEGFHWEKITKIEKKKDKVLTVAVNVDDYHTYLGDFYEHNSDFIAILHYYWVYVEGGQCVSTAPSNGQLTENIWNPINILWDRFKHNFEGECLTKELRHNNTARAYGRTAKDYDVNSFQGKHTPNLLLIEDEANGITHAIDTGIKSCATGENSKILRTGNPVEPYTPFYYNCLSDSITLSVFHHENISWAYEVRSKESPYHRLKEAVRASIIEYDTTGKPVVKPSSEWPSEYPRYRIPGAVDIQWVEDMRNDFGEGSIEWLGRVEAQFPISVSNGVVSIPKLQQCREFNNLEKLLTNIHPITLGLDIGGGSDPHCISYCRGNNWLDYRLIPTHNDGDDLERLANGVIEFLRNIEDIENEKEISIGYDATGEGSGSETAIKNAVEKTEFKNRIKFYRIKTGSASSDNMLYVSLKAEQLGTFALDILARNFLIFLEDDKYQPFEQEIAFITKSYSRRNRALEIISKEDYKKKTGKSHDITDSLMMSYSVINNLVESSDNKKENDKNKTKKMLNIK